MAPLTLHCVRHAQGYHNLSHANHSIHDPSLTPIGESQCADLSSIFPHHDSVSILLASPLRRTIFTANLSFPEVAQRLKIIGVPEAQEISNAPCDTGSDPAILAAEMAVKNVPVDLSLVDEGWNSKQGKWWPSSECIAVRARETRIYIRSLLAELAATIKASPTPDAPVEAIIVTHGGFLHYLSEDWEDGNNFDGTSWANCEYRTYVFEDLEAADAPIVETPTSRQRRGKTAPQFEKEVQEVLYRETMQCWEDQGVQNPSKMGPRPRRESIREAHL